MAVHDGDSYKLNAVDDAGNSTGMASFWVRQIAIDAPEVISNRIAANQPRGKEIGDSVRILLKGKIVTYQNFGTDKYGRVLARVHLGGHDVAEYMLRRGWAWYANTPGLSRKHRRAYQYDRDTAKKARYGLWSDENPIRPSVWRASNLRK